MRASQGPPLSGLTQPIESYRFYSVTCLDSQRFIEQDSAIVVIQVPPYTCVYTIQLKNMLHMRLLSVTELEVNIPPVVVVTCGGIIIVGQCGPCGMTQYNY